MTPYTTFDNNSEGLAILAKLSGAFWRFHDCDEVRQNEFESSLTSDKWEVAACITLHDTGIGRGCLSKLSPRMQARVKRLIVPAEPGAPEHVRPAGVFAPGAGVRPNDGEDPNPAAHKRVKTKEGAFAP